MHVSKIVRPFENGGTPRALLVERSEHKVNTRRGLNIAQLVETGSVDLI